MKLYTYIIPSIFCIAIICIAIICIMYYIKNKFAKKESYTNQSLKILQIGFSDINKTILLSKKTNDYLIVTTKKDNIHEDIINNINIILFNSYSNQLHDLFYYNLSKFDILYINSDYMSTKLTNFIISDILQSDKLVFKIVILQFDNKEIQQQLYKYYIKYANNIYVLKKLTMTNEFMDDIMILFNNNNI